MRKYLPWQDGEPGTLSIKELNTKIGCFYVGEGKVGFDARFDDDDRYWTFEADLETIEDAIAVCEQEYIAICTEFLKLVEPGECVVKANDLKSVTCWLIDQGHSRREFGPACERFMAAIEAEGGSK